MTAEFLNPNCNYDQLRSLAELMRSMGIVSIKHDFAEQTNSNHGRIEVLYLNDSSDEEFSTIWRKDQGSF